MEKRFWQKVRKTDGCWEWTAAKSKGYGVLSFGGVRWKAHRLTLFLVHGITVEPGRVVMHSCDNRSCVRPDHLRIGTQSENIQDAYDKGRIVNQFTRRSACSQGHEYSPDNAQLDSRGHRVCRACKRINALARYHRTKKLKRARSN